MRKIKFLLKKILHIVGIKKYFRDSVDKERIFKKYIENGKVILEEQEFIKLNINQLLNFSNKDYILHYFNGKKTRNYFFINPSSLEFPFNFLNLLSLLIVHGNKDDKIKSFEKKKKIIIKRPITLTCGESNIFAQNFLDELGVDSRLVLTLKNGNWNSYDNGHTLMEFYSKRLNKWILYDIDLKCYFKNGTKILNMLELSQLGRFEIVQTSNHSFIDFSGYEKYFLMSENMKYNKLNWYENVFHFFSIFDSKSRKFIFRINKTQQKEKIFNYSYGNYLCMKNTLFDKYFYDKMPNVK